MHHIRRKALRMEGDDGQAHAVDGDAVAQVQVIQNILGPDVKDGGMNAPLDAFDGPDFFNDAGEHGRSPRFPAKSLPPTG